MNVRQVIAVVLGTTLGCSSPGTFNVTFTWAGGAEPTSIKNANSSLYMYAQVEATADGGNKVVAEAGPQLFPSSAPLTFTAVPNGTDLVVTAELRDAPGASAQVLAYGVSAPFTLAANSSVDAGVVVDMQLTLQLTTATGAIEVVTDYAANETSTSKPTLRLIAPQGTVAARLSNLPDLAAGAATTDFNYLTPDTTVSPPSGYEAFQVKMWNLNAGIPACTQNPCPRTVYGWFTDANGFHSPTASADIVINTLQPSLTNPTVSPNNGLSAGPLQPSIVVVAPPSEPLWATAADPSATIWCPVSPPCTDPVPAITPHVFNVNDSTTEIPNYLCLTCGSDYTFTHTVQATEENGQIVVEPNAQYYVVFDLIDEAGNPGDAGMDQSIGWEVLTTEPNSYVNNVNVIVPDGQCTDAGFTDQNCPALYSAKPGFNNFQVTFNIHSWGGLVPPSVIGAFGNINLVCNGGPGEGASIDGGSLDGGSVDGGSYCDICMCGDGTCPVDGLGDCDDGGPCAPTPSNGGFCNVCTCQDGTCPTNASGDCPHNTNCYPLLQEIGFQCNGTIEPPDYDGGENPPPGVGYPGTGTLFAVISVFDPAGNGVTGDYPVVTEYVPPKVAYASVGYEPGASNPLFTPNAATSSSVIDVTLEPDEELTADPLPSLEAILPNGATLHFKLVNQLVNTDTGGLTEVSFKSDALPNIAGQFSTSLPMAVTWSDQVGNSTDAGTWTNPPVLLNTKTPSTPAVTTSQLIVYSRTPWGSNAVGDLPTYTVDGGAGAASGAGTVIVYDGTGSNASELGRGNVNNDGSFGVTLSRADHPLVYVTSVDGAGNVSPAVQVHDIVWTGTYGFKVSGQTVANPHSMETTQDFAVTTPDGGSPDGGTLYFGTLSQDPDFATEADNYDAIAPGAADAGLSVAGATLWEQKSPLVGLDPSNREYSAMAYDLARGRSVLFGGYDSSQNALNDTWEWDGHSWTSVTPTHGSPPTRSIHAMAYDSARGVTVLFGGYGANGPTQDTWEWSGTSWTQANVTIETDGGIVIDSVVPSIRSLHAMAYDLAHEQTILFGGQGENGTLGDTWAWDGTSWQLVNGGVGDGQGDAGADAPDGGAPHAREMPAMAYDANRGVTVLFGGCAIEDVNSGACDTVLGDTWEWNGTAWTQRDVPGPTARYGQVMTYDLSRNVTVLFGGCAQGTPDGICSQALNDTWEWNGSTWSETMPPSPIPGVRVAAVGAFDAARGNTVVFGGCNVAHPATGQYDCFPSDGDTWTLNGAGWTNATVQSSSPDSRWGLMMAFDDIHEQTLVFGGFSGSSVDLGDTWTWNGAAWTNVSTTGPHARDIGAMVFDSVNDRAILFGGCGETQISNVINYSCGSVLGDTWEWNGATATWSQPTLASGAPPARTGQAMAFDSGHGVAVMFGGCTAYNETTPGMASTYECVLADGKTSSIASDTWTWNTATSKWTNVTPTSGNPPARFGQVMAYDSARGHTVMFGGCSLGTPVEGCSSSATLGDTWEWDGAAWHNVTPAASAPTPPPLGEASMEYDSTRGVSVLMGGYNDVAYSDDTWEWNGKVWTRVTASQTVPAARAWHGAAYDSARGVNVLFGGTNQGASQGDTWEAPSNPSLRPAEIATFSVAALGATNPTFTDMNFTATAGARGTTLLIPAGGVVVPGATLAVWDVTTGGWLRLASNVGDITSLAGLSYETKSNAEANDYVFGGDQSLNLAFFPTEGRGNGATTAEVSVNYVQVIVKYTQ